MNKRHIYIGADSAGYFLKQELIAYLREGGYEVTDCGTDSDASCHYPLCSGVTGISFRDEMSLSVSLSICFSH